MSSPREDTPAVRVSDADRDRVATALREHCVAGRLTLEARTEGDLERLTSDLPASAEPRPPAPARKLFLNVIGGLSRKGRWRAAERITVVNLIGGVDLDLRGVEIEGPEIVITEYALIGGMAITVPEGIDVEVGGFTLIGGVNHEGSSKPPLPGAPRIRVRGFALIGGTHVAVA